MLLSGNERTFQCDVMCVSERTVFVFFSNCSEGCEHWEV